MSTPQDDAPIDEIVAASPAIDVAQVQVSLPADDVPSKPVAASSSSPPVAAVATAASSSTSASPPVASNGVSAQRMAVVRSQVTDACHITPAVEGGDGNVFVHVIESVDRSAAQLHTRAQEMLATQVHGSEDSSNVRRSCVVPFLSLAAVLVSSVALRAI
jgi:hypothetical protein